MAAARCFGDEMGPEHQEYPGAYTKGAHKSLRMVGIGCGRRTLLSLVSVAAASTDDFPVLSGSFGTASEIPWI